MIYCKTAEEIEKIRKSSLLVGSTLAEVAKHIAPGVKTIELDKIAETFIKDHGAHPAFLGYKVGSKTYQYSLCISVNAAVVHGLPSDYILAEGDIVSLDCGVLWDGFYGDSAYTFAVGEVSQEIQKLMQVTKECLNKAIAVSLPGNRVGDISFAVQNHAENNSYGVVRELVGHGVGKSLHEEPEVPNFGRRGVGPKLLEGMVIAIEPMINLGKRNVRELKDGWTIIAADNKPSAHYEHTIAIQNGKADILSSFEEIEKVLRVKQSLVLN
jgi:methionyl aminopeptidase